MRIGIFQLLPAPEAIPDSAVIEQALWETDFAEAGPFDSVWVTEHHLSSFGLIGAPSVYAAAIAQRTRRIAIGHAVAVVPLHHPIRLAEEIAWLTHLSAGRVLVGLGPGFSAFEFGAYGVPLEERHERLEEGSAVLRGLLREETFEHRGRHWTIPLVTLRPRPFGGKAPGFLRASSSVESFREAAAAGEPVMLGLKSLSEISERLGLYRSIRAAAGATPEQIAAEIGQFRVLRRIVVADTDDEAMKDARRALAWEASTARRVHEADAAPATIADGSVPHPAEPEDPPGSCIGSPETVLAGLRDLRALGIRHTIAWVNFGDLPYVKVRRTMKILAQDVIPALAAEESERAETPVEEKTTRTVERAAV